MLDKLFALVAWAMVATFCSVIIRNVVSAEAPLIGVTDVTILLVAVLAMAALDFLLELRRNDRKAGATDPSEQRDQL